MWGDNIVTYGLCVCVCVCDILVFSKIIDVEVFFGVHVCENISWMMWNAKEATNDKKETRLCEVQVVGL